MMSPRGGVCGTLVLVLVASVALKGDETSKSKRQHSSLIGVVVRAELAALNLPNGSTVCLSVRGRDASRTVLLQLQKTGLAIKEGSQCMRRPQGTLIAIENIARAKTSADVAIESVDMNLDGSHFATLLHKGVYHVKLIDGAWEVQRYTPHSK